MSKSELFKLGRGDSRLSLEGGRVIKRAFVWEPDYMRRYPDVFVPVHWVNAPDAQGQVFFAMPALIPSRPIDLEVALNEGGHKLLKLWAAPRNTVQRGSDWSRSLADHLQRRITNHNLNIDTRKLFHVLRAVAESRDEVSIHGDATLANIVCDHTGTAWWWVDPLDRPYIPGDPHVDLGKMYQSCYGYERVLLGQEPGRPEKQLMRDLAKHLNLSHELGQLWCYVHIVRLLPYQDERCCAIFEQLLKSGLW